MSPIEKQREFGAGRMQLPKLEGTKLIWNHVDNDAMGADSVCLWRQIMPGKSDLFGLIKLLNKFVDKENSMGIQYI